MKNLTIRIAAIIVSIFIIISIFFVFLGCVSGQRQPDKDDYDIPESFDRADCLYRSRAVSKGLIKKEVARNALECQDDHKSLAQARKEQRAIKRIAECKGFKEKGFQTQRECVLFID